MADLSDLYTQVLQGGVDVSGISGLIKGDIITSDGAAALAFPVGANDTVLKASSGTLEGVEWAAVGYDELSGVPTGINGGTF